MTSHLRAYCNSGLKNFAVCLSAYCNSGLSVCPVVLDDRRERQNIARAYGTGVGARRGHWFNIAIMFLLVIRHPTCASCVAWMCCRMSNSIKHVWACPDQSSRRGHRYLSQSYCCWCYVIQPVHHVLHECVVGCPILSSMHENVLINHRGVGIAIYCNHVVLCATSSNLSSCIACMCCRMSSSIKHHRVVGIDHYFNRLLVDATSSNLCIIYCMNVL